MLNASTGHIYSRSMETIHAVINAISMPSHN